MKLRKLVQIAASSGLLFSISSLAEGQGKHEGDPVDIVHVLALVTTPMPLCYNHIDSSGAPNTSLTPIARVVRVVVPSGFNLSTAIGRNVRVYSVAANEGTEATLDKGSTGAPIGSKADGPFDVDLTIFPTEDTYTEVRLILRDRAHFNFYDEEGVNGVAVGDNIGEVVNKLSLCGAQLFKTSDGIHAYEVARFYIPMKGSAGVGHYNFVVVPKNNPTTKTTIDPKVTNNG